MGFDPARWFTSAELASWRAYHLEREWLVGLDLLLSLAFFAALLTTGNRWLVARAERLAAPLTPADDAPGLRGEIARGLARLWGDRTWSAAIVYLALYLALELAVDLPMTIYAGWVRPTRWGLLHQPIASWAWDTLRATAIQSVALGAMVLAMLALRRRLPRWWAWLGVPTGVALAFAGALDPYRSELYFDHEPLPAGALRSRIEALAARAQLELGDVVVQKASEKHKRVDAFVAGLGPTRRVVLLDNLVARYTEDEIVAVVAHELGHVRERENEGARQRFLLALSVTPLLWALERMLRTSAGWSRLGIRAAGDPAVLPLLVAVWLALSLGARPLQHHRSRADELQADRFGLELTGRPDAFVSMFVRLARDNKADLAPSLLSRALTQAHPAIGARIEQARDFARARGLPDPADVLPRPTP